MDLHTMIGLAGVAGYFASYLMLQLGLLDGNGVRYSVANVLAAALVLISLTDEFNLASALIQVIWIVIGVSGLALRVARKRVTVPAAEASHRRITQIDAPPHERQRSARSPFRAAPSPARGTHDLVPDSAGPTGRPALGLRADVLNAFEAARSTQSVS